MSNNRMAMVCAGCGAECWFASYSPSTGWYAARENGPLGEHIRAFLTEHGDCRDDRDADFNADAFTLRYAIDGKSPPPPPLPGYSELGPVKLPG